MSKADKYILLVEDNEGDVEMIRLAFQTGKIKCKLTVAYDGEEGMKFLLSQPEQNLPNLILLDLNMPKMDGRGFLELIKKREILKRIPIIMLTSSNADKDILDCYDRNVNCYITKPFGKAQLSTLIKTVECFWTGVVESPIR